MVVVKEERVVEAEVLERVVVVVKEERVAPLEDWYFNLHYN
jgi:hypothetical protein